MQYLAPKTTTQSLMFTRPVVYDSGEKLKFNSYLGNFDLVPSVEVFHNYIRVSFELSQEQADLFARATEFKVQYGSATDHVAGVNQVVSVIQYEHE